MDKRDLLGQLRIDRDAAPAGTGKPIKWLLGIAVTGGLAFVAWFVTMPTELALAESRLAGVGAGLAELRQARLDLEVHAEVEYHHSQANTLSTLITTFGYAVGSMMAIGAVFAALTALRRG